MSIFVENKEGSGLTKDQKDLVRGLTIVINKLHLRYEDDYYSTENPYSFGVVIEVSDFCQIRPTNECIDSNLSLSFSLETDPRIIGDAPVFRKTFSQ